MKKVLFLLCLMAFLSGSVLGQTSNSPYSIVAHTAFGYGAFPGLIADMSTSHRIVALGVDEEYDLSEHWALLFGLDYQYRYFSGYSIHAGPEGVESQYYSAGDHIVRIPIRFEYHKRWFYLALGSYIEKGSGDISESNSKDIATFGPIVEMGGRIRLSEKSKLRIGLQTSVGANLGIGNYQNLICTRVEASSLLRIGYEYHF